MQNYRFYLQPTENTYFHVTASGNVEITEREIPLRYSPVNWDAIQMQFLRNETNWGVFTKQSEGLSFPLDGATILRHLFYTDGYEAKCILRIDQLDTHSMSYRLWDSCDVDFSGAEDMEDTISVNLIQRGLNAVLDNRRDTPYEIPIDGGDVINCMIDGIKIRNVVGYTPLTYLTEPTNTGVMNLVSTFRLSELGTGLMPNNISSSDPSFPVFFTSATTDTVRVTFKNLLLVYNYNCTIILVKQPGAVIIWQHTATVDGNNIPLQEFNIPMLPGETLRCTVIAGASPVPSAPAGYCEIKDVNELNRATVEVEGVLRFTPTAAKGYRYFHFLQKLVDKMTDGRYTVKSDFLSKSNMSPSERKANFDNDPWNTIVLCGNSVRGLPGSAIKTTVADTFKDCWARWCLGFGIEDNVLVVEPISYFLNRNLKIQTITAVDDISISPYNDGIVNQVKVGYGEYSYDELSGKDEFNASATFLLNKVERVKKEDDCTTPFRADMFGIEKIRNYFNPDAVLSPMVATVDNDSDNDVFLLEVDPSPVSGYYVPYRANIASITGLQYPESAYNLSMSPMRIFLRHAPRIMSNLPTDRGLATFQTSDKNRELSSNLSGGVGESIDEDANIDLNQGAIYGREILPIWKPYKIKCNAAPRVGTKDNLVANKYGYVEIVDKKRKRLLSGFLLDVYVRTTPDTTAVNDETQMILLAHPDSTLL